ncbi:MAG TPA: hypothetical protein VJY85_10530 [Candidatus Limnocylindria bacterium]|nr:hypothetical protein [Candidatus Limnocylindria bacterium]
MTRAFLSLLFALGLVTALPATALAATPLENHVLSRDAYATFSSTEGRLSTSVLVASSRALYMPAHGAGGGVVHQGVTSVEIIVEEAPAEVTAAAAGGGGGGGTLLADWYGQVMVPLHAPASMARATVTAVVPMVDEVSGDQADAVVNLVWLATGPAQRHPVHLHHRYPGIVILNTNSNDTLREAVASGTVMLNGVNWTPDTAESLLSTTRFHCRQIGHGHMGSDWGLCF